MLKLSTNKAIYGGICYGLKKLTGELNFPGKIEKFRLSLGKLDLVKIKSQNKDDNIRRFGQYDSI